MGKLSTFDLETGQQLNQYSTHSSSFLFGLAVSNKLIATGNVNGQVFLLNKLDGTLIKKLEDHGCTVRSLAFSTCQNFLLTVSDDFHITLVDMQDFKNYREKQQKIQSLVEHKY